MENKKAGRPKSIATEEMISKLLEVAERYPGKITYSLLEKETGITRRKWQYDKKCVNVLEKINADHLNLSILSKVEMVQKNLGQALKLAGNNPEKINAVVNRFTETMNDVLKIALEGQKYKEEVELKELEIKRLKEQLLISKENENKYKSLLAHICVSSKYDDLRRHYGVETDLLSVENNLDLAGAVGNELDKAINSLFEYDE